MTAELILAITMTLFAIAASVVTCCRTPMRRTPYIIDLLNATFGHGLPRVR